MERFLMQCPWCSHLISPTWSNHYCGTQLVKWHLSVPCLPSLLQRGEPNQHITRHSSTAGVFRTCFYKHSTNKTPLSDNWVGTELAAVFRLRGGVTGGGIKSINSSHVFVHCTNNVFVFQVYGTAFSFGGFFLLSFRLVLESSSTNPPARGESCWGSGFSLSDSFGTSCCVFTSGLPRESPQEVCRLSLRHMSSHIQNIQPLWKQPPQYFIYIF